MPGQPLEELSRDKLKAAIFELADVWCLSTDPQEYIEFLGHLSDKITYKGTGADAYNVL